MATLPVIMFFTIAMSMFASVVCKDDSMAMFACVGALLLLCALTPVPFFLGKALTGAAPFSAAWLILSPAYGPWNLGFNLVVPALIWENIGATMIWAIAALLIAGYTLNRTWRTEDMHASGWWWQRWQNCVQGTHDLHKRLRDQVLPWKPFEWLVRSQRKPEAIATAVITSVVVLWLIGWAAWPAHWPSTTNFFLTAVLLISAMDIIAVHAAARHFAEARQSGAFEILLTTPLSPDEIVDGLTSGVREQLRPLRQKVFLLCVLMAVAGLACRSWNIAGLITYALIWTLLLLWCGSGRIGAMTSAAWVALNTGRTMFALTRTSGFVGWQFIWIVFNLKNLGNLIASGAGEFPSGSTGEVVFVVFVAIVFAIIMAARHGQPATQHFLVIRHMRSIATFPIPERDDPRLKGWKWRDEPMG